MNPVIKQLLNRHSVRNFTVEPVTKNHLDLIVAAGQQAPTSINGQQISLIITQDKTKIAQIAAVAGGQPQVLNANVFITIVIDYHRTKFATSQANLHQVIHESAEGIVVGAGDAGIMLNALQSAANSLGYGSTAIGGIRNDPQAMIDLLKLPKNTFPIVGMTLGVADTSIAQQVKPRVPTNSFAMYEEYDADIVEQGVIEYQKQLREWWDVQGLTQMRSYNEETAAFYSHVYFPDVAKTMQKQGFIFKDE